MCSGHMTERSNECKGFKYLSVYSKHAQATIKNINAKNAGVFSSGDLKQQRLLTVNLGGADSRS